MLINLLNLLSQTGKEETIQANLEMDVFHNQGKDFPIEKKEPVQVHLLHKGEKLIELEGSTNLVILIPCDRCLESVPTSFRIKFKYELDLKLTEEERKENLDEQCFVAGTDLDVERLLYNEILLNWPARVLCKEDCQGICSHCGANLNKGTCDCNTEELDPRMAAIKDIFSKFKEV